MDAFISKSICVKAKAMAPVGILTRYANNTFGADNRYADIHVLLENDNLFHINLTFFIGTLLTCVKRWHNIYKKGC